MSHFRLLNSPNKFVIDGDGLFFADTVGAHPRCLIDRNAVNQLIQLRCFLPVLAEQLRIAANILQNDLMECIAVDVMAGTSYRPNRMIASWYLC